MSLKIILTPACFCSLAALCLQGVEPPCACPTALGVHRAKCCSSAPSWPVSLPALVTAFVFVATYHHNSDLDYTTNLVQEW